MEESRVADVEWSLIKLGIYQIAGGLWGLCLLGWQLIHITAIPGGAVLLTMLAIGLFGYSTACGYLCLKFNHRAVKWSLVNQLLQLLSISVLGCSYFYVAGIYLNVGMDLTHSPNFSMALGWSDIRLRIGEDNNIVIAQINLMALGLIFWIDRIMKKQKSIELMRMALTIGDDII